MTIEKFFKPKSIAIVGASRSQSKPGGVIVHNLLKAGFKGDVYPVNPHADEIENLKCYKSVKDLPKGVDLAVVVIPAKYVVSTIKDCGKKGIKNVILISAGFSEIGNSKLEETLKSTAKKYDVRIIGPNCMGLIDTYSKIDTLFLPQYRVATPLKGKLSLLTQSGAVGATCVDWASRQKLGFSKMVSYGNKIDIDEVDLIEYLASDRSTNVIMIYMEGLSRGRDFVNAAKKISKKKPIVVVKSGKSDAGAKAVASHTGSLAGSDRIYDAAFDEAGIIRAEGIEQMFDYAKALSRQPLAKGKNIQIVTCGGGFGVMATDKVEELGLNLATMEKSRQKMLKKHFPGPVVVKNPIDLTGDATPEMFETSLREALSDKNVDGIIVIFLFQLPKLGYSIVSVMEEVLKDYDKPVLGVSAGSEFSAMHLHMLEVVGLPMYPTPERAAVAMSALVKRGETKLHNKS